MRLLDFKCPECGAIEFDVAVPTGPVTLAPLCTCLVGHHGGIPMVRLYSAVPQVWHTGGRGG